MIRPALLSTLLVASLAQAEDPQDHAQWLEQWQFDCNAPFAETPKSTEVSHGGFKYELKGGVVKLRRESPRPAGRPARLGAIAGIKELEPETQALLSDVLAKFEKADVDAILIGGDTAEEPEVLQSIYAFLVANTKRPLLTVIGNTERAGAHNYAVSKAREGHPNLINMGLTRRLDGEGFDVVSLSGYHDKRYLHLNGGCLYTDKAIDEVAQAAKASDDPVVFLTHGPPKQSGKPALDFVPGAGNVGDPAITKLIKDAKIPFGVFGHILEAAGHGTDLAGKVLPEKKAHPALYVNQGSCNPLPWKLNDGTTSYGLAAILTVQGKSGSYEIIRAAKPKPAATGD